MLCAIDDRLVAAREHVPAPPVHLVEALGIDAVELPHPVGEIRIQLLYEQMIVVGHEAVHVPPSIEALAHISEQLKETPPVAVTAIDRLTPVTTRGDRMKRAGKLESEVTDHT